MNSAKKSNFCFYYENLFYTCVFNTFIIVLFFFYKQIALVSTRKILPQKHMRRGISEPKFNVVQLYLCENEISLKLMYICQLQGEIMNYFGVQT